MGANSSMLDRYSSYEFDDYREEAFAFWRGLLPWPVGTEELLFIPEAVNEVGFRLFPREWDSSTFCDVFTPELHDDDDFIYDEESYVGRYLRIIVKDVEERHGLLLDPKEAYLRFVASDKADTRDRITSVARILLKAFRKGDIKTFKQRIGGGVPFVEMQPIEWTRDDALDWFAFCHDGHAKLPAAWLRRKYPAEALPSFIFVSCSSLYAFLNKWGYELENYHINFKVWIDQMHTPDSVPMNQESQASVLTEQKSSDASKMAIRDDTDTDESLLKAIRNRVAADKSKFGFTHQEFDIHVAVESLSAEGALPKSPRQRNKAISKLLTTKLSYQPAPNSRSYQRYFRKLAKIHGDK